MGRTFLLEGKVVSEMAALVVATEHEEGGGIENLVDEEEETALNREVSTVHIVSLKRQ